MAIDFQIKIHRIFAIIMRGINICNYIEYKGTKYACYNQYNQMGFNVIHYPGDDDTTLPLMTTYFTYLSTTACDPTFKTTSVYESYASSAKTRT